MEFSIKHVSPEACRSACVIVGVYENRQLSPAAERIDQASQGYLREVLRQGDLSGKLGATLLLRGVPGCHAERVLLVGLGKLREFSDKAYRQATQAAVKALATTEAREAVNCLVELPVPSRNLSWRVRQAVISAEGALYRFDALKSKREDAPRLARMTLAVARSEKSDAEKAAREGQAIAAGMKTMRDLANLPPNHCTPLKLAERARQLSEEFGFECTTLGREEMERLGMNALLAVAKGSCEPPQLLVLKHMGNGGQGKPIVLVGKGVTFDSGGISLKPAADMDEMKFDMSGAASVIAALQIAAQLKLPLDLIGLAPCVENLPSGSATKPGDVVTTMSGQTVEILNTDAEGRLILCDALTYAERFDPACVIDVATLTGACVIALGHVAAGVFGNDERLVRALLQAGEESGDRAWQLPLFDDYQEQLKSNFADFANIGGRPAGAITAAAFLSRFTSKFHWAHLDIAGVAYQSGKEKGSTGRPVPLLAHFLLKRAAKT
ncbi:MAG: leucyl aminopeptidase [Rhodocyclaceae bacterium]|nr:leucyl aminopeptidase [Rhodocyclaceae bacterium]